MEDNDWTVFILSLGVFFIVYVSTMEEDERMNSARQSRIIVRIKENKSIMKNYTLMCERDRKRKRKHRMRLRMEKLQGSLEVNDYLESNILFSSADENKSLPETTMSKLPPLAICDEEWETVSHPSPDVKGISRFWFWK